MISEKDLSRIFDEGKSLATQYQMLFDGSVKGSGVEYYVALSALVMGIVQSAYARSKPGDAVADHETMKAIVAFVLKTADEKIQGWDDKRMSGKSSVALAVDLTKEMMKKLSKSYNESENENDLPKRKPGDSVN